MPVVSLTLSLTRKASSVFKAALPDPAVVGGSRTLPMLSSLAELQVFLLNGSSICPFFLYVLNRLGVLQNSKSNSFLAAPSRVILRLTQLLLRGTLL